MSAADGLDLAAVQRWLGASVPGLQIDVATLIAGGKSNLTYRVRGRSAAGEVDWVLRRPPLGLVTPSAHDMAREHRVVSALAGSAVPVPPAVARCDDVDVTGAVFAVYAFVPGRTIRTAADAAALAPADRRAASLALVDVLADLHGVDASAVGLASFGRPDGFVLRQVRRWADQWDRVRTRDASVVAGLVDDLAARVPRPRAVSVLHGDLRLDNVLLAPDEPRVAAVVDWEMAALGDPLTDLATLLVYLDPIVAPVLGGEHIAEVPGFAGVDELVDAYSTARGSAVGDLDFYLSLAYFKLAVIAEGIHHRYLDGDTVGDGFDAVGDAVVPLLERAEAYRAGVRS